MTNQEALLSKINISLRPTSVETALLEQSLAPGDEYNPKEKGNVRGIDLALAALILVVSLSPKSVKELDYQITQQDVDQLLKLRAGLLKRHGVDDEMSNRATITSVSDLW